MRLKWTKKDSLASRREGWMLSDCSGEVQLQKVDDPSAFVDLDYDDPVFKCDGDAWLFVVLNPTPLHIKAGHYLARESHVEHNRIRRWVYLGEAQIDFQAE